MTEEGLRIDELRRYDVLETEGDAGLDRLCELAARACRAPMAALSFVDEHELRLLAQWGVPASYAHAPLPLEQSFCHVTIRSNQPLVVRDALADERFAKLQIVVGEPHIRFYAGAAIVSPRGYAIATICVLDLQPQGFDDGQRAALLLVRDAVMELLQLRRETAELRRSESLRQEAVEALLATQSDLEQRIALRTRELRHAHEKTQLILEELEKNRARLIEAQRVAHVGSFEWTVDGNRVVWSDELYRIYGVPLGTTIDGYEGFLSRVHVDDLDATKQVIGRAVQNGTHFVYDHRIVRSDGEVRMLHTKGEAIAEDGKVTRLAGSCWDVTEQWQAHLGHLRAMALLEATLAVTYDGLIVFDADGKVVAFNQRFAALWQLPSQIAPGDPQLLDRVAERLVDGASFLTRLRGLRPDEDCADRLTLKDGRVFEARSRPQRVGGDVAGRVCSFRDVTS